jgi:hypothetical protein
MRTKTLLATVAVVALAACSEKPTSASGSTGMIRILLTDAPFPYDQVARVDVYIVRVAASVSADTAGAGPGTIVTLNKAFNLLELSNGEVADLGSGPLVAGNYRQVLITINADLSSITLKDGRILTSGHGITWYGPSVFGIGSFTDPPLQVTDRGAVVAIDFNLGRSFRPVNPADAGAGFEFIGYIAAINTAMTGSIRGTVTGAGGGLISNASVSVLKVNPVYPADTAAWGVFGTTRTDAAGAFMMPYVRPDADYVLRVEAPATSSYGGVASAMAVKRGATTELGILSLPLK